MQKIICILMLTTLLAGKSWARLGETEEQCVARYGQVLKRSTFGDPGVSLPLLAFAKNGYFLGVIMLNGKCGMMMVQKSDSSEALTDNEIDNFLQADSAGQKWTKSDEISMKTLWIRDDGAQAQYDPIAHTMCIISKEYIVARDASQKKAENEKQTGF